MGCHGNDIELEVASYSEACECYTCVLTLVHMNVCVYVLTYPYSSSVKSLVIQTSTLVNDLPSQQYRHASVIQFQLRRLLYLP